MAVFWGACLVRSGWPYLRAKAARQAGMARKGYEGGWLGQGLMRLLTKVAALAA